MRDLIITAPAELRAMLEPLSLEDRVSRCASLRINGEPDEPWSATKLALRSLAKRFLALSAEMADLEAVLDELTTRANPALKGAKGVGTDTAGILLIAAGDSPERLVTEASFSALCGVAPVQASSGKTTRHRLNRSGNRQANHALWRIVQVRMIHDNKTKDYVARRTEQGLSRREIVRCLKRYVAREVYHHLVDPKPVPLGAELRAERVRLGIKIADVAAAFGTSTAKISFIERGVTHDAAFSISYLDWLGQRAPRHVSLPLDSHRSISYGPLGTSGWARGPRGGRGDPFTPSPLHPFTPSPLHPFTPSPLHPFTPSPLHPFTPSPLHRRRPQSSPEPVPMTQHRGVHGRARRRMPERRTTPQNSIAATSSQPTTDAPAASSSARGR